MKTLDIVWVRKTAKYSNGDVAKCSKYIIGAVDWTGGALPYNAKSNLPGIKSDLGDFATKEEAQKRVEFASNHWINELNIK